MKNVRLHIQIISYLVAIVLIATPMVFAQSTIGDFDSGELSPWSTWGAPLSVVDNPDGTEGDKVALLDQTGGAWSGIAVWYNDADIFVGVDSLTVDVYANTAGTIKFHCDNSESGAANYEQYPSIGEKTWKNVTLLVSDLPATDYKQLAMQYDQADSIYFDNFTLWPTNTTRVDDAAKSPVAFALEQNYPNPFNPTTTISYSLPTREMVELTVFDALGRQVSTLVNESQAAGLHSVRFDMTDLASGVYFYQLKAGEYSQMKKMVRLQ